MSISGSEGERRIRAKLAELQSKENTLSTRLSDYEKRITSLMDEREKCLTNIALIYLPELDARSIESTLRQVQTQVKDVFRQKQSHRESLESQMKSAISDKELLEQRLDITTSQLNQKAQERDEIVEQVNLELSERDDYNDLAAKAEEKNKDLSERTALFEKLKADWEKKLEAYVNNEEFMYLVNRHFGTLQYKHKGLIRIWDSHVARTFSASRKDGRKPKSFEENKKDYDFLTKMPGLMHALLDQKQTEYKKLASQVESIANEIQERHSLPKVIREGEKLTADREKLLEQIKQKEERYQRCSQERQTLDTNKGEYHQRAVQKIKDFLDGSTIADLKRTALEKTPEDLRDDSLVCRIEQIGQEISDLKLKSKEAITGRDEASERLRELNTLLSNYRSHSYEGDRSYFSSDLDMDDLLTGYMLGRVSSGNVWSRIETSQRFKPVPQPVYRSPSPSSSGSSFSSFSRGGGIGGGGFSRGRGF